MRNKRKMLYGLAIIASGLICYAAMAQQKKGVDPAGFSGEWSAKESIAMGGNIVCCYDSGDRMLAKTMKIAQLANALTVQVSSSFPGAAPVASQEKITFDGKTGDIDHGSGRGKQFTAKLSADRQTITINSTVRLIIDQKQESFYITEVWKLSDDGRSISVQANAKSSLLNAGRSWKTVFNRAG